MDNYTCYSQSVETKVNSNSEELFKEVLDQLLLKDNIINELQGHLESERMSTTNMKKTILNLETKLANLVNDNQEISVMNEINNSQIYKNKTVSLDKILITNTNDNPNTIMINDNSNQKFQTSSGINFNHNLDYIKLIDDKNELEIKYNHLEKEFNAIMSKNRSITEIEEIYKKQLENQKKKIEFLEKNSRKIQEKEEYFEELIKRYNNLEKENQNIIVEKDIEIKEIHEQISMKNEEIEKLRQYSENNNADLLKELRTLEEKNRQSELKLMKIESIYKEEIRKLQKIATESQSQIETNNSVMNINNNNNKYPSSIALNVDDLATSFTKSIKEKIESQNKKISSQTVEILSLQYDHEKLMTELKYEREMCDKLQKTLAEHKYNRNKSETVDKEEAQVQTVLKGEDIESAKMKNKILDDNLTKISESHESNKKICRKYEEREKKLLKEISDRELEVDLLKKKLDKLNKCEKIVEKETLNTVSNNSKLNLTISLLKKRENDLIERIQILENNMNTVKNTNKHLTHSTNIPQKDINQLQNEGKDNKDEINSGKTHLENNREYNETCNNADSLIISADSNAYQMSYSNAGYYKIFDNRSNINREHAFNQYENNYNSYPNETVANTSHNPYALQSKDLLCDRYELELKKMQEDNYYLREQSFKLISDVNRLTESLQFYKSNLEEANSDRERLYAEKEKAILDYECVISNLQAELDQSKNFNKDQIEELRNKLLGLSDINSNMNEQLKSLQNKFYVQSQLIGEKNQELMKEKNSNQGLKIENSEILKDFELLQEKFKKAENESSILKVSNEKLKNENMNLKQALSENESRNHFALNEMEERSRILQAENQNLKEISNKIKIKLNEMYEENKQKENKLINLLKDENNELESRMMGEISELRKENENLSKERSNLRLMNNELKYENGILKDQLGQLNEMNRTHNSTKEKFQNNSNSSNFNKKILAPENELKNLREENFVLKNRLEEFSSKFMQNEKSFNLIKIDLESSEIEKQSLSDIIKAREEEINILKSDLKYLNENAKNSSNIEQLLNEINTKNQTINYLIEEIEMVKKESKQRVSENEIILSQMKEQNENLSKNLTDKQEDFDKQKINACETISDLKKENEILLQEIEEKEKERDGIISQITILENELSQQANNFENLKKESEEKIYRLKEENNFLSEKVEELTHNSIEKFNKIQEKNLRSRSKISSLIKVYETHIKLLKERFENILNDFSLMMNVKINSLSNKEFSDKFSKLCKNLESSSDLQSKISEREALIENAKSEIKIFKANLANAKFLQTKLTKENEELKELLKVKKLQMKIAEKENPSQKSNSNISELNSYKLLIRIDEMEKVISELQIKENDSIVKLKTIHAEVQLISDDNHFIKETNRNLLTKNNQLEEELSIREREINDLNKSHKLEIVKIIDELKRIKERWIPPEKQQEYTSQIEELEKTVKSLKEDVNRKRELIATLRTKEKESNYNNYTGNNMAVHNNNINDKDKTNTSNLNDNNSSSSSFNIVEDKMKILNKEISRKDNLIKELRTNLDTFKQNEKKYMDDVSSLTEKSKINKIEINRKEAIIKEYKEKLKEISNDSNNDILSKINEELKESIKKLKSEIERKDTMVKTIKAKLEASCLEVDQLRNMNIKLSKSNTAEVDREQKEQEHLRAKLDLLSHQNENFASFVRRIFKELITKYERLRSKANIFTSTNKHSMQEGLDILGVSQDELEDYLNPTDKDQNLFNNINKILEGDNIICEVILNLYNSLNDKISTLEKQLKINMISQNNFDLTGEK